jgi:hypothetical protein
MDIRGRCCYFYNKKDFKTCPARIDTAVFHLGNERDVYCAMEYARNRRSKNAIMRKFLLKTIKLTRPDATKAIEHFWYNHEEEEEEIIVKPKRKYVRKPKPVVEPEPVVEPVVEPEPEPEPVVEPEPEPEPEPVVEPENSLFYLSSGSISKTFYENYIKEEISKKTQKKFEDLLKDEDEDYIEYYRVGIDNPTDRDCEFSSLWFFDINLEKGYMPVFKSGVNTSSYMAMEMCGMDREDEDDITKSLEELLEYAPNGSEKSKELLKKVLLNK